jgi:ABC-type uncharacterized transport system substrate-binding protein
MEGVCSAQIQAQNKHSREAKGVRCEGKMNKQKLGSFALCAILFALCASAAAQQPKKVPRIGFLGTSSASALAARIEAFRHGLHELGYLEGKNIVTEWRSAEGKLDRLPTLATELVLRYEIALTYHATNGLPV